ncbi:hypothetical protein ACQCN2_02270 [Brevibacillus ginsengisoli]|uniref:hypothetical protein n=1 Tax=Brevibacillus ginsengisoli TaxID=363854 RepID=UPI003CFB225E
MMHVIIGLFISFCLAALARRLWPITVGRNKKFTSTILLAFATVALYFWVTDEYGFLYPTYGLGLLVVCGCLIVLFMLRQHRQYLDEQSVIVESLEGLVEEEVHRELPVEHQQEMVAEKVVSELIEEKTDSNEEEQGWSYSSDQEAIDAMIQEFYRHTEQDHPTPSQVQSGTPSSVTEEEIEEIVQSFINQENREQGNQSARNANTNLEEDELLLSDSWRQAVSELDEEILVSDLSSLLREELGASVEQIAVQSTKDPTRPETKGEAYQPPVHQNSLANETPSSIVLKMEELVIPVEIHPQPSVSNEKPSGQLFELNELLDVAVNDPKSG